MSKHTPGPWRLDDGYLKAGWNGVHLFKIREMPGLHGAAQANARLLTAAPDLLAALVRIMAKTGNVNGAAEQFTISPNDITAARAAIAKAEGVS